MPKQRKAISGDPKAIYAVLYGSYLATTIVLALSITEYLHSSGWLAACGLAFTYLAVVHMLYRSRFRYYAVRMLVLFFMLLGVGLTWEWGINTPISILIFGLAIMVAGMLLTTRCAAIAATASGILLIVLQTAVSLGWFAPASWRGDASNFSDVIAHCMVFAMLTLVAWLYNREVHDSLVQTEKAHTALRQQETTLNLHVEERTAQLRQAQLKEVQQMYRFAELGQLGATLLHDLANHLTALTLEIDGLKKGQHNQAYDRSRDIIHYLEEIVDSTRDRMHGNQEKIPFNIIEKTGETITFLRYKATRADVAIDWEEPIESWEYLGDPASFCQIIAIVTNNAIDAYGAAGTKNSKDSKKVDRVVTVSMQRTDTQIIIRISNLGKGIPKGQRKYLFKPFHSTKELGLGIGLFIAQQTVETNFFGKIVLNPRSSHTEFIITLPRTAPGQEQALLAVATS